MNILAVVLQILLGLMFLGFGASTLARQPMQMKRFDHLRLPQWFRSIVGIVQIIGALGILAGVVVPWLAAVGALWLVGVMLGALVVHIRVQDTIQEHVPAAVVLIVAAIVAAFRWSDLVGYLA